MNIIDAFRFKKKLPIPLHWWDLTNLEAGVLDKGSGSGGWGHLVTINNVSTITDAPDGTSDSLDLDQTAPNDYLTNMGDSDIAWDGAVDNGLTVSIWVKKDTVTTGDNLISWREEASPDARIFSLGWVNATPDYFTGKVYDADSDEVVAVDTAEEALTATWYHLVLTHDRTDDTARLYIDNVLIDSTVDASIGDIETTAAPFTIGATPWSTGANRFDGKLWQAAIWDSTLDADQISTLYSSGNGGTYSDFYGTPSFGTNPTSTDLFAWWSLDDDQEETDTYDLTNNNTATFTSGYNGNAVTLDGTNQYLSNATGTGSFPTGAQTWACFFKADAVEDGILMSKLGTAGNYSFQLLPRSTNAVDILISGTGSDTFVARAASSYTADNWIHVAAVYDPDAGTPFLKIYIDGVEKDSNTTSIPSSIHDTTAEFQIGARDLASSELYFDGQIHNACLFSKALSADEIKWLLHGGQYADLT